ERVPAPASCSLCGLRESLMFLDSYVTISRLLASHGRMVTQGCPCGFLTDPQKECVCTPLQIQRYRSRVSGPLLDRIDIQVEVPTLRYQELANKDAGESSGEVRQRVNAARSIQLQRFVNRKIHANAQMGAKD